MKTEMRCKNGGSCIITLETRKKCKKCRFEACLREGMRAEAVMNESQYKRWFRRMIRKQRKNQKDKKAGMRNGGADGCGIRHSRTRAGRKKLAEEDAEPDDLNMDDDNDCNDKIESTEGDNEDSLDEFLESLEELTKNVMKTSTRHVTSSDSDDVAENLVDLMPDDEVKMEAASLHCQSMPVLSVQEQYLEAEREARRGRLEGRMKELLAVESPPALGDCRSEFDSDADNRNIIDFVKYGRLSWMGACESVRISSSAFSQKLFSLHKSQGGSAEDIGEFTTFLLRSHLETIAYLLKSYAYQFPEFRALPCGDQQQLLSYNTKLFGQYFLGRYFFAGSGYKQQQWLLLCQVPDFLNEDSYLRFLPITTFDGMVHLFTSEDAMKRYEDYARALSDLALNFDCNCAIALLCLYNIEDHMTLQEQDKITQFQDFVLECSGWAHNKFNCAAKEELLQILALVRQMSLHFDSGVDWNRSSHSAIFSPDMSSQGPCSLERLLKSLQESLDVFPFGEDLIKEYAMYTLDVPFSKTFLPKVLLVWADRLRYAANSNGIRVSEDAVFSAVALAIARQESCVDGRQQTTRAFGRFDTDILLRKFPNVVRSGNFKKVTMASFVTVQNWDLAKLEAIYADLSILKPFAVDEDIFKLYLLALLLKVDCNDMKVNWC